MESVTVFSPKSGAHSLVRVAGIRLFLFSLCLFCAACSQPAELETPRRETPLPEDTPYSEVLPARTLSLELNQILDDDEIDPERIYPCLSWSAVLELSGHETRLSIRVAECESGIDDELYYLEYLSFSIDALLVSDSSPISLGLIGRADQTEGATFFVVGVGDTRAPRPSIRHADGNDNRIRLELSYDADQKRISGDIKVDLAELTPSADLRLEGRLLIQF